MKKIHWRRVIGWILFVLSFGGWVAIPVITFMKTGVKEKAEYSLGAYLLSQLLFITSLYLLGTEYYDKIKAWIVNLFKSLRK